MKRLFIGLVGACMLAAGPTTTVVADTIYAPDGTLASGVVYIELATSCQADDGTRVYGGTSNPVTVISGKFSVSIIGNNICTPTSYYRVTYDLRDANGNSFPRKPETWVVASSPTAVTISAVVSSAPGSSTPSLGIGSLTGCTAKGSILAGNAGGLGCQAVGTNNHVLVADSTQTRGVKWAESPALATDTIGTSELDDGADTPGSGDYVRVDTVDQAGFEYRTTAEVLSDIGAAAAATAVTASSTFGTNNYLICSDGTGRGTKFCGATGTSSLGGVFAFDATNKTIGTGTASTDVMWKFATGATPTATLRKGNDSADANLYASDIWAGVDSVLGIYGRSKIGSQADGYFSLYNNAGTDFSGLRFGGSTSSFPMWKRSSTLLQARLADDSGYTSIEANAMTAYGTLTASGGAVAFGGASSTVPNKTGISLPGTCAVGQTYYKSDAAAGLNIYGCTATNVWTLQGDGGGGTSLGDPGSNGIVVRTALNTTTARSVAAGAGVTVSNGDGVSGNPTVGVDYATVPGLAENNLFSGNNNFGMGTGDLSRILLNDTSTGTTLYKLAKSQTDGAGATEAVIYGTGDTQLPFGLCSSGCGTSGNGTFIVAGRATCTFDGATTEGHYVIPSVSVAGACASGGATEPTSGVILGKAAVTVSGAGNYTVLLDIRKAGGSGSSPLTTKGDIHGYTTVDARLPVGGNSTLLTADSTAATGLAWKTLTVTIPDTIWLQSASNNGDSTVVPTAANRTATAYTLAIEGTLGTASFPDASDTDAYFGWRWPDNWNGGTVDLVFVGAVPNVTGTLVRMLVATGCIADNEANGAPTYNTETQTGFTVGDAKTEIHTISAIDVTNCAAGEFAVLRVIRDGDGTTGTDDHQGVYELYGVEVKFVRTATVTLQ